VEFFAQCPHCGRKERHDGAVLTHQFAWQEQAAAELAQLEQPEEAA
jgi:hypothetical protein